MGECTRVLSPSCKAEIQSTSFWTCFIVATERFSEQADLGYNPAFFMNTGQGNLNKRITADPFFILKAGNILPTSQSSDENQMRESR